jgi:Ca2+-binding RTX toxin-like protein
MPLVEKIFLEMTTAVGPTELGGHLYLVKRTVLVDQAGTILSNNYDSINDQVVRGSFGISLGTYAGPLGSVASRDRYSEGETPQTRHSVDITDQVGGVGRWSDFQAWASAINDKYYYEVPFAFAHTANSNAVPLTLLANAGVDIRTITFGGATYVDSFFYFGAPGANKDSATLLAVGDVTSAASIQDSAPAAEYGIRILGRDNLSDTFINTKLNEKFFGEQVINGSSIKDVVSYEGAGGPLTMSVTVGHSIEQDYLQLSSSNTGQDDLFGIEQVKLSNYADRLVVSSSVIDVPKTTIDAGTSTGGDGDILDFSTSSTGIRITQHDDGTLGATQNNLFAALLTASVHYANFEKVILTSQDDSVKVSGTGMTIDLGGGNDRLESSGPGTIVYTGDGEDRIEVSHNGQMLVADASTLDRMTMYGFRLTGGIHWHDSQSPYAFGKMGERYGRNGNGDLVIKDWFGNETFVANFNFAIGGSNLTAGIYVIDLEVHWANIAHITSPFSIFKSWEDLMGHAMKALTGESHWGTSIDPLVFDLNGNGLTLSLRDANIASFDIDQDGFSEHVGWVRGGDGLLVRDINANGVIDNIGEMFGNATQSGFAQLATLDGNHDGKVDAADNGLADFNKDGVIDETDTFDTLKMWIDANEDGKTDAGELVSLASLGIASISVSSTLSNTTSVGNTIVATGTFTRTDGTTGTVGHVDFKVDDFNTKWLGDNSVSAEAAARANIKGHGTLTDLHVAMTIDPALATAGQQGAPPTLIEIFDANLPALNTTDLSALREAARPILTAWANAVHVPAGTPGQEARADFNVVVESTADGPVVRDFLVQKSDELGAYWGLASGHAVLDENGVTIARPTQAQVLASVPEDGSWTVLKGEDIRFLERYLGDEMNLDVTNNPGTEAIAAASTALNFAWHELDKIVVRLASQGPLESFFAGVEYDPVTDLFKPTTAHQLVPTLEAIFTATPAATSAAETFIAGWKDVIDVMMPDFQRPDGSDVTFAYLFQNLVGAYENVPIPLTLQQAASVLDIPQDLIKIGAGNLNGTAEADLFYLDSSNQYVRGGAGYDSYIVGRDFGHDTIQDVWEGLGESQEDAIRFAHLNANELNFRRDGLDLIITQIGTDNEIRVVDQFFGRRPGLVTAYQDFDKAIEIITFADGTVWDKIDIAKAVGMTSYATDDTLIGTPDVDVLNGGLGNDYMSGGSDGDHYMFDRGDGHDTIEDNQGYVWMEAYDLVHFGAGISRSDLSFERDGNSSDLRIRVSGTDDVLTVTGQFRYDYGLLDTTVDRIEVFTFADGDYLGWEDILKIVIESKETAGDDIVHGFSYTDTLDGGAGNDYLSGHNESDTYIFGRGYGHDTVHDDMGSILASDTDVVVLKDVAYSDVTFQRVGNSEDFSILVNGTSDVLTVQGQFRILYGLINVATDRIEQFKFSDGTILGWEDIIHNFDAAAGTDGNDAIYGFNYADTLTGGHGDDVLQGGREDDTYIYNRGDGNDTIIEVADAQASAFDTLVLHGITTSSVSLVRDGNDIKLVIAESTAGAGDGGSVKLKDEGDDFFAVGLERITFDNGTVWSQNDLRLMVLAQAATSGNDTIIGFNTNDTLRGGAGNDALDGKAGDDSYVYVRGGGNDVVTEAAGAGVDTLVLEGINPSAVGLVRNGNHLTLMIAESTPGAGDGGSILLNEELDNYLSRGVENIQFANGTTWHQNDLRLMLLVQASTAGNDTITGFNVGDMLRGGVGNDSIFGRDGDDTYIYARGDGNDVVTEDAGAGFDTLMLEGLNPSAVSLARIGNDVRVIIAESAPGAGNGGSILLKDSVNDWLSQGVEQIKFADGTIWSRADIRAALISTAGTAGNDVINGSSSADVIAGGLGNDTINGGSGSDIYIYRRGDGNDVISDSGNDAVVDNLTLTGISPSQVSLVRNGIDVTLVVAESTPGAGDGGSIQLKEQLDWWYDRGIERVTFDDGTIWSANDLRTMLLAQASTSGNDTINGFNTADTLQGGGGNDMLNAGSGDDTYVYGRGDGNDVITENSGNLDKLVLHGIAPAAVSLVRDGIHVTLVVAESALGAGDGGSILIKEELDWWYDRGIEQIAFDDGTTWTANDLRLKLLAQASTSGNDTINGFNTADTLQGGAGNDTLIAGSGDDTYIYARGDGNDVITENSGNLDKLVLHGIAPAAVSLVRDGIHVTLVVAESALGAGDGGSIQIKEELDWWYDRGIEQIAFDDGTTWTPNDLRLKLLAQASTSGNDTINGFNTADTLQGGAGNDTLNAGSGDDTYIYARGDGNDVITENSGNLDKLVLHGIAPAAVNLVRDGIHVTLVVAESAVGAGDGGSIQIKEELDWWYDRGVEQIIFDNGTVWSPDNLRSMALTQASTPGNDTIIGFNTADVLAGGSGNDTMTGAGGNDTFVFRANLGKDVVTDFVAGSDVLEFRDGVFADAAAALAAATSSGSDTLLTIDADNTVLLKNVPLANLHQTDFHIV